MPLLHPHGVYSRGVGGCACFIYFPRVIGVKFSFSRWCKMSESVVALL